MTRTEARPPRRIWPWFLAGAALLAAAVTVLIITLRASPVAPGVDAAPADESTLSSTPVVDQEPTGCLGGPNRDAAMLLSAQAKAPHTTNGAVEVAAAMVRWTFRDPGVTAGEAADVTPKLFASTATDEFKDLTRAAPDGQNNSAGVVPNGTPFYLSTVPGVWHVEAAEPDHVEVSIGAAYVIDGELSPQLRSSSTLAMVWEGSSWKLESGSTSRSTQDLYSIGTTFSGGC